MLFNDLNNEQDVLEDGKIDNKWVVWSVSILEPVLEFNVFLPWWFLTTILVIKTWYISP